MHHYMIEIPAEYLFRGLNLLMLRRFNALKGIIPPHFGILMHPQGMIRQQFNALQILIS